MKTGEASSYVPSRKTFPDGTYIRYWADMKGKVWGQLFDQKGRAGSAQFTYQGPNPASWDKTQ